MGAFISEIGLLIIMEWDIIDIMHSMGTLPILNQGTSSVNGNIMG